MIRTCLSGILPLILMNVVNAAPPTPQQAMRTAGKTSGPSVNTQRALEKELAGDNAARDSILRQELLENPDAPFAHWQVGEVRHGDKWLRYDRVADDGDRWKELYRYSEERDKRKDTVEDHLFLADGARSHGLLDQERAHLKRVVTLAPGHQEAHQRLGDVYSEGAWIPRERFGAVVLSQLRWSSNLSRYGAEAEKFTSRLRRLSSDRLEKARDEWLAWCDPEKLPALERAVGDRGDGLQAEYVRWLGHLDSYEASRALVRQTLFSENQTIRTQATEALKERPWEHYMPELVGSLAVVRPAQQPVLDERLNVHRVSMSWETMDSVVETQWFLQFPIDVIVMTDIHITDGGPEARGWNTALTPRARMDYHRGFGLAAAKMWQTIQQSRADGDHTRNERALRTIGRVAGTRMKTAQEAWDWWGKAEDVLRSQERISRNYGDTWYVDTRRRTIQPSGFWGGPTYQWYDATIPMPISCLVAGTSIVTETGARSVESLEIGDRVLSQDPDSGELSFKPIIGKTIREKAKLHRLKTADDEIVCSQGHPFWVNGAGWIQTRSLEVGMPLHTVSGATEIAAIEPAGEGSVYNIIVEGAHTYFVGKNRAFLSHDVTPRKPTNALVPGLMPIWGVPSVDFDKPLTIR